MTRPPYNPEHFPPNEFVTCDGRLYPHAVWLDAINTAGLQLIAERTAGKSTPRAVGRALQNLKSPGQAAVVRERARALMVEHCKGLHPNDAPADMRVVGVIDA